MKAFLLSVFCMAMAAALPAQQVHFVYLQSDSHKPFYAMLNNKTFSSSSIGYVILPKLQNGDYSVRIGFPKSEAGEQEFLLQIKDNDQGFLVKDFGEKGWGLFNLQSMAVQYAGEGNKLKQQAQEKAAAEQKRLLEVAEQRRTDSLQAVAQLQAQRQQQYDDSVKNAIAAAKPVENTIPETVTTQPSNTESKTYADSVKKAAEVLAVAKENERLEKIADSTARVQAAAIEKQKENAAAKTNTNTDQQTLPIDSVPPHLADPDVIAQAPILLQKKFTDSGWRYTYAISNNTNKENIDVFIPYKTPKKQSPIVAVVVPPTDSVKNISENTEAQMQSTTVPTETKPETQPKKEDTKFLDFNLENNTSGNVSVTTDTSNPGVKILHNSNCRAVAGEKDFLSARKKIVSAEATDKMIATARKLMKEKCFTTEQIRNLSFLFLTDADRYQFLDAAYPFALDAYRYNSLQDLLKEDYYIQRFKAMLR